MDIEFLTISEPCVNSYKVAAFDFDWTLVKPKGNRKFPKSVDDWEWLFPNIPSIIQNLYKDEYTIVIFTNQSKEWKREQIVDVANSLNIPMYIGIAFNKAYYKPSITLYEKLVEKIGNNIDKNNSFFVGDALGRKDDFSDSDKMFAENIGIKWVPPEDMFYNQQFIVLPDIPLETNNKEIIIMVGYPGSGKSTIADTICQENENYVCIKGDIYKTSKAMIKKATDYIKDNKSIIFDATNGSRKKRAEYIEFAKKYEYTVIKCVHVNTSMDEAYQRNKMRPEDKQVPRIAYSVYKKHFESPDGVLEGFILINV